MCKWVSIPHRQSKHDGDERTVMDWVAKSFDSS